MSTTCAATDGLAQTSWGTHSRTTEHTCGSDSHRLTQLNLHAS